MRKLNALLCLALALSLLLTLAGCASAPIVKSGEFVTNAIEGAPKTEYVIAVSKKDPESALFISELNKVIADTNVAELTDKYMDFANRRKTDPIGEINLLDNDGGAYIYAYTCVMEPFNYSGAGGAYADGVDVWLLSRMTENLGRQLQLNDCWYQDAYDSAKDIKGILAMGVALNDQVKNDFLVTDVYSSGYQQIISDKNENFTKLEQLKGLKIGVLIGRTGSVMVSEAIKSGALKGTGASMVEFNTDAEAYLALKNGDFDVLVIDELPAKMLIARGY